MPHSTVWRILKKENLYPYHSQKVQNLLPGDSELRLNFCKWLQENRHQVSSILFTDEASFTRDGVNNMRNKHNWDYENPHATVESCFQHRFSINVWCGIIDNHLVGPFIFEGRLTGNEYLMFLQNNLPELLENLPLITRQQLIFQQDGAPIHFARGVRNYLNATFGNNWIGREGPINWPPRSPDLTPMDYYVWGHMKSIVYAEKVTTKNELMERILNAFEILKNNPDTVKRATQGILRRADICVHSQGGHFEQLL